MKKKRIWSIAALLCLILGIISVCGMVYANARTESIQQLDISTGDKNESLAYDVENDILYMGSHSGILTAYQDETALWSIKVEGAFTQLVLNEAKDKLYAANEGQHVYIFQTSDGATLLDIPVQRKVVGVSANQDESKIAVITETKNKSNLLVYDAQGTELANTQFKNTVLRGVNYCQDNETIMIANKRGEISKVTEEGEILDTYKTNYETKQMKYHNGYYWAVSRIGTYDVVDEELNCIRKGQIDNTVDAVPSSIGVDDNGEYIVIGTEEGYIFVMDSQEKQIYVADHEVEITDTATAGDVVYFTGYGDFVKALYVENLANVGQNETMTKIFRIAAIVFAVGFAVCVIGGIDKLRVSGIKLAKAVWRNKWCYIMLVPTFTLLYFFSYKGIFIGLSRAFTNWSVDNYTVAEMDFVGLDNFKSMISEGYFMVGLKNMLLLLLANIVKTLTMPLAAAWLLYSIKGDRRKYIHRFLFVLPIVVPGVVGSLVWQKIYDPSIGLLNQLLAAVGLENLQRVWLGDSKTAMGSILAMGFPYIGAMSLLVYYGGLINISEDVIESAKIDGAGRWQIFSKIQLPILVPQIELLLTLSFLGSIQEFNSIYIMTGGGPGTSTYVPALELYLNVAQFGRYGYASAMGVVLLIFTLSVTIISNILKKERD